MEDAATAEISRAQIWQWIHHGASLADGRLIDISLFRMLAADELKKIRSSYTDEAYAASQFERAHQIIDTLVTQEHFEDFLTLVAYKYLE